MCSQSFTEEKTGLRVLKNLAGQILALSCHTADKVKLGFHTRLVQDQSLGLDRSLDCL